MLETNSKNLYYLAHPYTGDIEANLENCVKVANALIDKGYDIYVPILMTHPLDQAKPREHHEWMQFDEIFMERCDGLILAGDWKRSKGCVLEYGRFLKLGKEVVEAKDIIEVE